VFVLDGPFRVTQPRISVENTTSMLQQRRKIQAGSPCMTRRTVRFVIEATSVRTQLSRERRHIVRRSGLRAWLCLHIAAGEVSLMKVEGRVSRRVQHQIFEDCF